MKIYKQDTSHWYLERIVFLLAGIFILGSVFLGLQVSPYFFYFTTFIGAVMTLFALTGYCPMAIILEKIGVKTK